MTQSNPGSNNPTPAPLACLVLESIDSVDAVTIHAIGVALREVGLFQVRDRWRVGERIDAVMARLPRSEMVRYAEATSVEESAPLEATYCRLDTQQHAEARVFGEFVEQLLPLLSQAIGKPAGFLEQLSARDNLGLYLYDPEPESLRFIRDADPDEIVVSPHRDSSLFTIVVSIVGLEGRSSTQGPDRPSYVTVQAGTALAAISDARVNVHRVRGGDSSRAVFWARLEPVGGAR